jgi:outer membrane lipoprotein carrier protein
MTKILAAYILSLFGFPVWTQPAPAPATHRDAPALRAEASAADAAHPAPPERVHAAAKSAGSAVAAKTDAGTASAAADAAHPAARAADAGATTAAPPADAAPPAAPTADAGATTAASAADAAAGDAGLTADQIIARVQTLYDGTTTFQANFRQVFRHRLNPDRSKEATGVVYLQKPGKMRWEYHDPERKLIVSDGSTLWAYEPEDDQVFEQSLSETDLPSAVSFLLGSGSLAAEFDVRLVEADADASPTSYVLELRPKVPSSHYSRLLFVVDRADYQVLRTVVVDHSGNTNSIEFAGAILNGDIPASQFRFVRPEGARVIR